MFTLKRVWSVPFSQTATLNNLSNCTFKAHSFAEDCVGNVSEVYYHWHSETQREFASDTGLCYSVSVIVGLGPLAFLAAPLRRISSTFIPPSFSASEESSNHSQWSSSFQSRSFKSSSAFLFACQATLVIHLCHKGRYRIDSIILCHRRWYSNILPGGWFLYPHILNIDQE